MDSQSPVKMPLRQHLYQSLLRDLMNRLSKIMKCQKGDPLIQALHTTGTLTQDYCWPYLKWDAKQNKLVQSEQKPISMDKMMEHVTEMVEAATDVTLVQRFGSLNPKNTAPVIPWRLQVSLRHDRHWELLLQMCHSSIWSLLGVSFKAHTPNQSQLAKTIQAQISPSSSKGKGKGKKGGS